MKSSDLLVKLLENARVDNMPFGGVKDSELGRQGIRYAIQDMTELRRLVIRDQTN